MCTFFSVITQSQDHWHHHSSANRPALLFTWGNIITRFQCMNYILSNLHQMPLPILKTRHAQRYFGGTTPTKIKLALWQNHWGGQICPSGSVGDRPLQAAFQTVGLKRENPDMMQSCLRDDSLIYISNILLSLFIKCDFLQDTRHRNSVWNCIALDYSLHDKQGLRDTI